MNAPENFDLKYLNVMLSVCSLPIEGYFRSNSEHHRHKYGFCAIADNRVFDEPDDSRNRHRGRAHDFA